MSAKGYGGFNRIPMHGAAGTVIAGKHVVEEPKPVESPTVVDTPTKATNTLLVPYEDRQSRIRYLRHIKDYLTVQLAIVEQQLTFEEEHVG
jgi:hypothetical protein